MISFKQLRTSFAVAIVGLLLLLVVTTTVSAHESAYTLKYADGDNLITGLFNVHEIQSGIPVTYDWRIYSTMGTPVSYKNLQISVLRDNKTIYKTDLPASKYFNSTWKYSYPAAGTYSLVIHFTDTGSNIATGNFPIVVEEGPNQSSIKDYANAKTLTAFVLGILAVKLAQSTRVRGYFTKGKNILKKKTKTKNK